LVLAEMSASDPVWDRVAGWLAESTGAGTGAAVRTALFEQESRRSTVTPEGVAFPHALLPAARKPAVVPVIAPRGFQLPGASRPATLTFFLVGSSADPWGHIRTLARLSRCVVRPDVRTRLLEAKTPAAAVDVLLKEDARHG
jgi:mannitol/fructose-specific phosphotransferase system IIA component (Ntr-type)